jgi:hypothetical protein
MKFRVIIIALVVTLPELAAAPKPVAAPRSTQGWPSTGKPLP